MRAGVIEGVLVIYVNVTCTTSKKRHAIEIYSKPVFFVFKFSHPNRTECKILKLWKTQAFEVYIWTMEIRVGGVIFHLWRGINLCLLYSKIITDQWKKCMQLKNKPHKQSLRARIQNQKDSKWQMKMCLSKFTTLHSTGRSFSNLNSWLRNEFLKRHCELIRLSNAIIVIMLTFLFLEK